MNHLSSNNLFINIHLWELLELIRNIKGKILLCKRRCKMTPLSMAITDPNTPTFLDWSKVLDDEEWILIRLQLSLYVYPCLWNMRDFLNDVSRFGNIQFFNINSSSLRNRDLCCDFCLIIKFIDWRRASVSMKNISRISNILVSFSLLSSLGFDYCFWFLFNKLIQNDLLWRRSVNIFDHLVVVILGFVMLKNLNFEISWGFCDLF